MKRLSNGLGTNTYANSHQKSPEQHPAKDVHALLIVSCTALHDSEGSKNDYDQLNAVELLSAELVCQEAEQQHPRDRACQGDQVDVVFTLRGAIQSIDTPIHEGE